MKVVKAIYNFIVGDMIILVGVAIAIIILGIINLAGALTSLRFATGVILIVAALVVLFATLYREAHGKR
jgi:uncharacterized membrane protein YecN with MAPEG domain